MPRPSQPSPTARVFGLLATVVVVAGLYFAQEFFIPVALAVLLSFLLAPVVSRLERLGLGRVVSVVVISTLALGLVGALGWVVFGQVRDLAAELPQYQDEIARKVARLSPRGDLMKRLEELPKRVEQEVQNTNGTQPAGVPATQPATGSVTELAAQEVAARAGVARLPAEGMAPNPTTAPSRENPVPVAVVEPGPSPLETLGHYLGLVLGPLGTAGIVIVFVIFFLLEREDLRDRVIRLAGRGQLNVTTKALDEASNRISRYLLAQAMVNGSYGVAVGVCLWLAGLTLGDKPFPNVVLWALLCAVLRFIPYIGPWIAAAFPLMVSFAVFQGYSVFVATLAVFVVIELASNNLMEPWLYGSSTGMSAVAILVSAVFWTFLWGPVGLLLATPLTVCLLVLGKHVPGLRYLDILLGDEPAFEPPVRVYQRLLAEDLEEATDLIEEQLKDKDLTAVYDGLLLPVLALAEADWHRGRLDEEQHRFVRQSVREMVEDFGETYLAARQLEDQKQRAAQAAGRAPQETGTGNGESEKRMTVPRTAEVCVVCLPARDDADEIAGLMMAQLLRQHGVCGEVVSSTALTSEMTQLVAERQVHVVCVSALPPSAVTHARYLCKRLHARFPDLELLVGLWTVKGDLDKARARIACEASVRMANTFAGALAEVQQMIQPALVKAQAAEARG